MKRIILTIVVIQCALMLSAQNEVDALRYSQFIQTGTARFSSMAGAYGALGGDLSVMAANPAGIGVYRKSDLGISLTWSGNNMDSKFNGVYTSDFENSFRPTNAGFVIAQPSYSDGWKFINYGFSYNQLADFNNAFSIFGTNTSSSILDWEAEKLNSDFNPGQAGESNPFVEADAVFYDSIFGGFTNDFALNDTFNLNQHHRLYSQGYAGEYDLTIGANYEDVLFLGATLGFQHVRYEQIVNHSEVSNVDDLWLESVESTDYLYTKGTGINIKFGFIYKLNQMIRIGGAVHTPTWYNFSDDYGTDVYANINYPPPTGSKANSGHSPMGYYDWELTSPWHVLGNMAFVFGKSGLITTEYEFVGYQGMKMSALDYYFSDENKAIDNLYVAGHNFKIGAEYNISVVSIRGGFGYYGSPYNENSVNADATKLVYSGGAGVKLGIVYLDFAYQFTQGDEKYFMYNGAGTMADLSTKNNRFISTLGVRF